MIDGVKVVELKTYPDERGFFREIARFGDMGIVPQQISHASRITSIANGWHVHQNHSEMFYVTKGVLRLCLKDCRTNKTIWVGYPYSGIESMSCNFGESSTPNEYMEVVLSEMMPKTVLVPPGVAHAYKVLGGECDIVYAATATYETSRNDEGRIAYNHWPEHEWWREVEIR